MIKVKAQKKRCCVTGALVLYASKVAPYSGTSSRVPCREVLCRGSVLGVSIDAGIAGRAWVKCDKGIFPRQGQRCAVLVVVELRRAKFLIRLAPNPQCFWLCGSSEKPHEINGFKQGLDTDDWRSDTVKEPG